MSPKYASTSSRPAPIPARSSSPARSSTPLKTLRLGRLKAAIWENASEQQTFHNVKFARTYMDQDKKFHDTDSFSRDDLLVLSKLADQAHTFVCERLASMKGEEAGN